MKNIIFKVMAVAVVAYSCVSCDKDKTDSEEVIREYGYLVDGQRYKISGSTAEIHRAYEKDARDTRTTIVIPQTIEIDGKTYTITSIGEHAFSGNENLTSVTIPNTVTTIGREAFTGCTNLKSITIPEGVKSIGDGAFSNCGLISVSLPNSLETLGNFVFGDCKSLPSITIPKGVTSMGENLVGYCTALQSATFYSKVIGNYVLGHESLPNLTEVILNEGVERLGEGVFYACSNLKSLTLPASLKSIGNVGLRDCTSLTSLKILSKELVIDDRWGLYECQALTSIELYCKEIGKLGCPNLTEAILGEGVEEIGVDAFGGLSKLASVKLPNSLKQIDRDAFHDCQGLESFVIPDGVEEIGENAFGQCSKLTTVTIGRGVKTIGSWCFGGCQQLTDIYCHATAVPDTYNDIVEWDQYEKATLHVPSASLNAYKAHQQWGRFNNIVAF